MQFFVKWLKMRVPLNHKKRKFWKKKLCENFFFKSWKKMLEKNLDETNLKNRIFLRKIGKIGKNNFGKMLEKNFDKKKCLKQFLIKKCYKKRIHTKKLEKKFGKNIFEKNKKIVFRKIEKKFGWNKFQKSNFSSKFYFFTAISHHNF